MNQPQIFTDLDNWNTDMATWGLTADQQAHHLLRLHEYHTALLHRALRRHELTERCEGWFSFAALVCVFVLVIATVTA